MKKIVSFLLIAILCLSLCAFSFCACGKSSGISVEDLQDALFSGRRGAVLECTKKGSGYTFAYSEDTTYSGSGSVFAEYSGEADGNKMISSVRIVNNGVDASALSDEDSLLELIEDSLSGDVTRAESRSVKAFNQVTVLYTLFAGDDNTDGLGGIFEVFTEGKSLSVNGWKIKAETDTENSVCEIIADFS